MLTSIEHLCFATQSTPLLCVDINECCSPFVYTVSPPFHTPLCLLDRDVDAVVSGSEAHITPQSNSSWCCRPRCITPHTTPCASSVSSSISCHLRKSGNLSQSFCLLATHIIVSYSGTVLQSRHSGRHPYFRHHTCDAWLVLFAGRQLPNTVEAFGVSLAMA
jgi:hypothetical protein